MEDRTLTLTYKEIIGIIERCGLDECNDEINCPFKGECLLWWTGDDSQLPNCYK